jgi:hypothetical protein
VLEPIKAWGRPLVATFGGGVIGERDVDVLANVCDSAEEREHMTRKTETCIFGAISSSELDVLVKVIIDAGRWIMYCESVKAAPRKAGR